MCKEKKWSWAPGVLGLVLYTIVSITCISIILPEPQIDKVKQKPLPRIETTKCEGCGERDFLENMYKFKIIDYVSLSRIYDYKQYGTVWTSPDGGVLYFRRLDGSARFDIVAWATEERDVIFVHKECTFFRPCNHYCDCINGWSYKNAKEE